MSGGGDDDDPAGVARGVDWKLFSSVRFHLNDSLRKAVREQLHRVLTLNGAAAASSPSDASLTHWITDTLEFAHYDQLRPHKAEIKGKGKATSTIVADRASQLEGGDDAAKVEIVTPYWVTRSYDLQLLQQPRHYSPDPLLIFSGLCVCTDGLPETDTQSIAAGVQSLGGQAKRELTREVTHLLVCAPEGGKYDAWRRHGVGLGMVAVLPHWFEDCFKLRQLVPHGLYAFPNPPYLDLRTVDPHKSYEERLAEAIKASAKPARPDLSAMSATRHLTHLLSRTPDNEPYQRTALVELDRSHGGTTNPTPSKIEPPLRARIGVGATALVSSSSVGSGRSGVHSGATWPPPTELIGSSDPGLFQGHVVYLASDLGLRRGMEEAIKRRIIEAGGKCWSFGLDGGRPIQNGQRAGVMGDGAGASKRDRTDEWDRRREAEKELNEASIVIARTRQGWEWWLAYESSSNSTSKTKMIGNLAWVYHVLAVNKLDPPLSRILHFPLPTLDGVPELKGRLFTISNYAGAARDYVRAMIEALGGTFDGAMSKQTQFVVTASEFGNKVKHARQWGIPLVTHTWLEACLSRWSFINPALSTQFLVEGTSPAIAFPQMLGEARLMRANIEDWAGRDEVRKLRDEALSFGGRQDLGEPENGEVEMGRIEEEEDEEGMDVDRQDEEEQEPELSPPPAPAPVSAKKGKVRIKPPAKIKGKGRDNSASPEEDAEEEANRPEPKGKKQKKEKFPSPAAKRSTSELSSLTPEDEVEPPPAIKIESGTKPTTTTLSSATKEKTNGHHDSTTPTSKARAGRPRKQSPSPSGSSSSSSSSSSATPEPSFTRTFNRIDPANMVTGGSRRAAAGKAAQRLAEQMPDANRFAKELKSSGKKKKKESLGPRGKVKEEEGESGEERAEEEEEEEEVSEKVVARARAKTGAGAGKKRKARIGEEEETEQEENKKVDQAATVKAPALVAKKAKTTTTKGGRLAATMATETTNPSGGVSSFDAPPRGKPAIKSAQRKLMLMSTGLGLDAKSPEIKALKPLGITWTDNPSLVTHLVVRAMSRTEKFLCCLGVAPKIVTKEWIDASLKAGQLADEDKYLLKDVAKEREYKDTLVDILARAQAKQLFEEYTIYITGGVSPEPKTMQRICQSGGATVSISKLTPTTHNKIVENRDRSFVISCPGDRAQWEPLVKRKVPIYSVEAVFVSVMHQTLVGFDSANNNRVDAVQLDR